MCQYDQNPYPESSAMEGLDAMIVVDLRLNKEWDFCVLNTLFVQTNVALILQVPLSTRLVKDR